MSRPRAYYNEHDAKKAAWLRELIARRLIAPGDVDERSILDVRPSDIAGYKQCHFFAGVGVWSYALGCAGVPDWARVWTGSCPCQPFSDAGDGAGFADERHLWPALFALVRECRPLILFGEQVASALGLAWLDIVSADLEGAAYRVGACDFSAASVGAPHRRQRLYFVADTDDAGQREFATAWVHDRGSRRNHPDRCGASVRVANADCDGVGQYARELPGDEGEHDVGVARGDHALIDRRATGVVDDSAERGLAAGHFGSASREADRPGPRHGGADVRCDAGALADAGSGGLRVDGEAPAVGQPSQGFSHVDERGPVNGFWRDADWLYCTDDKWRPVEPGAFPLVDGAPARVGRLRGYGDAIVAPQAQAFIEAYIDVLANR